MPEDFDEWTADELLAELRGRERARATGARRGEEKRERPRRGDRRPAAPGVIPRFRNISDLSDAELAALLKSRQRAIYGVDDRQDIYQIKSQRALRLANASAALVEADDLQAISGGGWTLRTTSFKTEYRLCSGEPFASQPLGCFCSGVLVAPDVVATAGHCVKSAADLSRIRFVFGFRMLNATTVRETFSDADVYEGQELIGRKLSQDGTDWALVRLDRKVSGRSPVSIRTTGKIGDTEPLFVIGHPCGLPQKLAAGAHVRNNSPRPYFSANLDTYGGNSGSPVFSNRTYKLEGLLVRGQTDFVSTGSCNVSTVFPTSGPGGEDVTRATEWTGKILKSATAGDRGGKRRRTGGTLPRPRR